MIQCPKCQQSLPDWSQVCQFCNTDLKGVSRPKSSDSDNRRPSANYGQPAKWIWPTYYAISIYWIISGGQGLAAAVLRSMVVHTSLLGDNYQQTDYIGIILGGFTILTGIGLVAKIEFFRGVVNFLCFLQILGNLCGLGATLFLGTILGPIVMIGMVFEVFNIITAGLMVYIIGETD